MDLSSILKGSRQTLNVDLCFEQNELSNDHGIRFLSPLNVKGIIRKRNDIIDMKVSIVSEIAVDCSRCLADVEIPVGFEAELRLMNEEEPTWDDDYDSFQIIGNELDVLELVYSEILQTLPLQPLCSDDCMGLCSGCGVDLNFEECKCEIQTDSRFDILKELL